MCHSNFIVLLPHISPWTQIWIQAFIVAYQNLTFKSVKQNCCFRNQRWDAVKSRQALKKGCIKSTNQNAIFLPEYIYISNSNLNWYKDQPFSDWYIYKPVDMPHNTPAWPVRFVYPTPSQGKMIDVNHSRYRVSTMTWSFTTPNLLSIFCKINQSPKRN